MEGSRNGEVTWSWRSAGEQNHLEKQEDLGKAEWEGELNLKHDADCPSWVQGLGDLVSHRNEVLLKSRDGTARALIDLNCLEQSHMGSLPTPSAHGPGALPKGRPRPPTLSCTLL